VAFIANAGGRVTVYVGCKQCLLHIAVPTPAPPRRTSCLTSVDMRRCRSIEATTARRMTLNSWSRHARSGYRRQFPSA